MVARTNMRGEAATIWALPLNQTLVRMCMFNQDGLFSLKRPLIFPYSMELQGLVAHAEGVVHASVAFAS